LLKKKDFFKDVTAGGAGEVSHEEKKTGRKKRKSFTA
jgi:hypothetical protein